MTILNPHLTWSVSNILFSGSILWNTPPPPFYFQDTQLSCFSFNLIDYYISVSSLRPHSHGFCYHPVSFPSPPDSHILLPSLLSIQASPPNVLIWYLHSFWFMATLPKSGVSLISLTSHRHPSANPRGSTLKIFLQSEPFSPLSPHLLRLQPALSLTHIIISFLNSSPCFHDLSLWLFTPQP